jgi:hypothetical protein
MSDTNNLGEKGNEEEKWRGLEERKEEKRCVGRKEAKWYGQ